MFRSGQLGPGKLRPELHPRWRRARHGGERQVQVTGADHDGTVSVSVDNASGVAGANAALDRMHARVAVVPVRPGCPPIGSLPRPKPTPHPEVRVAAGVNGHGHRSISVKIKGSISAGDKMILAFTGNTRSGSVAVGGSSPGPCPAA